MSGGRRAQDMSPAERPYKFQASDPAEHVLDHGALWEAMLYLNRKVQRLEDMVDGEDE